MEGQENTPAEGTEVVPTTTKTEEEPSQESPPENEIETLAPEEADKENGGDVVPALEVLRRTPHVQTYRPTSAEIATIIDGFEDDFQILNEEGEDLKEEIIEEEEEDEKNEWETKEEQLDGAAEEHRRLKETNDSLSRRVREIIDQRAKGRQQDLRDITKLDGAESRYRAALKQWPEIVAEKERTENHFQTIVFSLKCMLEEKTKRADEISNAFLHFKNEVAKSSENSKTGRGIPSKVVRELVDKEAEKEQNIQKVRLTNIHFRNQLAKLEQKIREKEELAEGLHLIDFEQLKIENQSLNEKIEERNEELMKLRRKTTTTVQILTHIKEKLQFVDRENEKMEQRQKELELAMVDKREILQQVKSTRDKLRTRSQDLKEKSTYITAMPLLEDLEVQKEHKELLIHDIEELKAKYAKVSKRVTDTTAKVMALSKDMQLSQ
ncbi:hypothetical protein BSKO_03591 [Bryopsis sp. KO-2023]|nr:hypothetical protein BSKO_03591 [Bryopsis sp. KO-2023]